MSDNITRVTKLNTPMDDDDLDAVRSLLSRWVIDPNDLRAIAANLLGALDAVRAEREGRRRPPTIEEVAAHQKRGGVWLWVRGTVAETIYLEARGGQRWPDDIGKAKHAYVWYCWAEQATCPWPVIGESQ